MTSMIRCSVLLAVVSGCAARPASVEFLPFGSRADVVTALGPRDGYTIAIDCGASTPGRGNYTLLGDDTKPPVETERLKRLKDEVVYPAVRDVDFASGVGYGRVCGGIGIVVILSSWQTVDVTIARLGLLLGLLGGHLDIEVYVRRPGSL